MDELENNATAQDVKDQDLMFFRMQLLLLQYRRRLVSDLLLQVPKSGTLLTGPITGLKEKYSDLLDHLNNEISKTIKLVTDDVVSNLEEIEKIVVKSNVRGTPVLIRDIAAVQFGHSVRYGAATRNAEGEIVTGIVMMLKGANSSEVINNVKDKIEQIKTTLPEGVTIEPFLDRKKLVKNRR